MNDTNANASANASKQIRYVKQGDSIPRTKKFDTEAKTVTCDHVTKHDSEGPVHLQWVLDFSQCSERDLLELASRSVVIAARDQFKKTPASNIPEWDGVLIDAADYAERKRQADPAKQKEQLNKLLDQMSLEEVEALMAKKREAQES